MRPRSSLVLLLLAACTPKTEELPLLTLSADALDFGDVGVGEGALGTVTLRNAGGGEVSLLSVSLVEGLANVYDVSRDPVDTLGAGETANIEVIFSPSEERSYDGRVQVRSDDPENSSLYVTLTGAGAPSTVDTDGDGTSPATGDCNEGNPAIHPGADEICDGEDDDCDGDLPRDEADADYDGWLVCEGDCNDAVATIYPGAPEICDDADSDCDGVSADRADDDGDGQSTCDGDCDDAEPTVFAGNPETCDGLDNDCSGTEDDIDEDLDDHSPCGVAGDCDDTDASAYPVVVDPRGEGVPDGTEAHPYHTIDDAIVNLDEVCRSIQLNPGNYEVSLEWTVGRLTIGGAGTDASAIVVTAPLGQRAFDVSGGADMTLATMTVRGTTGTGDGGAVRVVSSALTLVDIVFDGNSSTGDGGAVAASSSILSIRGATFIDNGADDDGGAVAVLSSSFEDAGSTYEGNHAVRGGALLVEASTTYLSDLVVNANEATDEGGGIELLGGSGSLIEGMVLTLNSAGTIGGGLSIVDFSDAESLFRNLVIMDNSAGDAGGGVSISGTQASLLFANNTLLSNESPNGGGGVDVEVASSPELYLWSNIVAWSGGDSGLHTSGGGASVAYNLSYSTTSGLDLDLGGGEDAGQNETANPLFRDFSNDGDPSNDDLSLGSGSPANNSGPTAGLGPAWYSDWDDPDGSRNNRGNTGGPGAAR